MLSLLLGTLHGKKDKSSLYKVSKEWYYDRNVWKVVYQYDCLNLLSIVDPPYLCHHITVHEDDIFYTSCISKVIRCLTDETKNTILPYKQSIKSISCISATKILLNKTYITANLRAVFELTVGVHDGGMCVCPSSVDIRNVAVGKDFIVWMDGLSLVVVSKATDSFSWTRVFKDDTRVTDVSCQCLAVDDDNLIYVATLKGEIEVCDSEGHLKRSFKLSVRVCIPRHPDLVYNYVVMVIHDSKLVVYTNDCYIRVYTVYGKLIQEYYIGAKVWNMVSHRGYLLASFNGKIYKFTL
jgi:hypothetical protein